MSVERMPAPPTGGLNGGAMRKLSHGGRVTSELGLRFPDGVPTELTPDGYGVILYPTAASLAALRVAETPAEAGDGKTSGKGKASKASGPAVVKKGTSAIVETAAVISPKRGWAIVSAHFTWASGLAAPVVSLVPGGGTSTPRFLVTAVSADVHLSETTPIGVVGLLT